MIPCVFSECGAGTRNSYHGEDSGTTYLQLFWQILYSRFCHRVDCCLLCSEYFRVHKVQKCEIYSQDEGITINIDITVIYGYQIHKLLKQIQEKVADDVGYATGLNIIAINASAKG